MAVVGLGEGGVVGSPTTFWRPAQAPPRRQMRTRGRARCLPLISLISPRAQCTAGGSVRRSFFLSTLLRGRRFHAGRQFPSCQRHRLLFERMGRRKYTDEQLASAVASARNMREVLKSLG